MVLVHVRRFPNKQNHPHAIHPNETVGAVPVCPPERPRSGVSIQKYTHCARGDERCMRPCRATRAGTAPTNLHQTTRCAHTALHCTFDSPRQSHGVFISHRIAHSTAPNHAVCPYPIGVILSIAQGWQVQRSLPWVTVQARRLPPWGLYSFSSHIITTRANGLFANGFPTRKLILKSTMPMA